MSTSAVVINPERLESVVNTVAGHAAAAAGLAMFELGDRLGLYRAMADAGPITASDLAERTGCQERLVAEWLFSQAAAGYLSYDDSQTGSAPPDASTPSSSSRRSTTWATRTPPFARRRPLARNLCRQRVPNTRRARPHAEHDGARC